MPDFWGSYSINFFASIVSLFVMGIWVLGWKRSRLGYMVFHVIGWGGLCIYWTLLTITAGANPVIPRSDLAFVIRATLLVSMIVFLIGKIQLLRSILGHESALSIHQ